MDLDQYFDQLRKIFENLSDDQKRKLADVISKALDQSTQAIEELNKARKVDPKTLHDPFTI